MRRRRYKYKRTDYKKNEKQKNQYKAKAIGTSISDLISMRQIRDFNKDSKNNIYKEKKQGEEDYEEVKRRGKLH